MMVVNNITGWLIFMVPVLTFFVVPILWRLVSDALAIFEPISKEINHEL